MLLSVLYHYGWSIPDFLKRIRCYHQLSPWLRQLQQPESLLLRQMSVLLELNYCLPAKKEKDILTFVTVFENLPKSRIQHCERSELRLHFEWTKVNWNCLKQSVLASFWKPTAWCQTMLPDVSLLIGQKLVKNTKVQKFKCDILSDFQTLCKKECGD